MTNMTPQEYINTILGENGEEAQKELYESLDKESMELVNSVDEDQVKLARSLCSSAVFFGASKGISPLAHIIGVRQSLASLEEALHKTLSSDKEVLVEEMISLLETMKEEGYDVPDSILEEARSLQGHTQSQKIKEASSEEDIMNILQSINMSSQTLQ